MNWPWMVFLAFYLTYFIGFFVSRNPYFRFLETKLSFLIFPLLFISHNYTDAQRKKMLRLFLYGLLVAGLFCVLFSFYRSIGIQDGSFYFRANVLEGKGFEEAILYGGNYFFGKHFSVFHQTVYFALYFCSGIAILLFCPKMFGKKLKWTLLLIFTLLVFLISNKASFIALGLVLMFRLMTLKLDSLKKTIGVMLALGMIALFALMNPRTKLAIHKVINGELVIDKNARYGFATRILTWDAAWSLIKEKPLLGYGAGDTQQQLNEEYRQKEYRHPLKESYNAHNLWLQTWLENGLPGLLLLMGIFVLSLKKALWYKEYPNLFLALILVVFVNTLFESFFNRFSGVSFFSFLVCFILSVSRGALKNET